MTNGRSEDAEGAFRAIAPRELLILGGALLLSQLPFLNQALIIDGGKFVDQALQILRDPGAPYSFAIHLRQPIQFFGYFANPPGQAYYLAGVIRGFGLSEPALHLACLPFAALALIATHRLASQLSGRGLFTALLLLATPVFLVSSHTVMADVSTTAFYVVSVALFVRGVDQDDTRALLTAGIAGGIATFLKYSAASLLPLMLFYLLLRRRLTPRTLLPVAIVAAIFGAWCTASYAIYGQVHILAAAAQEAVTRSAFEDALQVVSALLGAGAAILFPPILLAWSVAASAGRSRRAGWWTGGLALLAFVAALPAYSAEELAYAWPNRILGGVFLGAGIAATLFCLTCGLSALAALRNPDSATAERERRIMQPEHSLLLVVWFLGFMVMNAGLVFATPKYLLPGVAPLLILLTAAPLSRAGTDERLRRWQQGTILGTSFALGLGLCIVSAAQGNFHRYVVNELVPEIAAGKTSWFTGHWSIRHYSERRGHRYLATQPHRAVRPQTGDILFGVPDAIFHPIPDAYRNRLEVIHRRDIASPLGILMANQQERAGYWAHLLGIMPYTFSSEPLSSAIVLRVTP